jgi:hypothetical protein
MLTIVAWFFVLVATIYEQSPLLPKMSRSCILNPITQFTAGSLKVFKKQIQTTKSSNFIGHNIFSAHLYTSLFNTLCISLC